VVEDSLDDPRLQDRGEIFSSPLAVRAVFQVELGQAIERTVAQFID
jgi:hypothetical protein